MREDDIRIILTAENGVALVVMDKDDYIKKAEDLLHNLPTSLYLLTPISDRKIS